MLSASVDVNGFCQSNADLIQVLKRIFHISNHSVVNGKIVQFGVVPRVGLQKC